MNTKSQRFIALSNLHFSKESYCFLYTSKHWEAKHYSLINHRLANQQFSQAIQKLRRTNPHFKYTAVREFSFNKTTRKWRYGFHIKVNQKINLTKIPKGNYLGVLIPITSSYFHYEMKDFNFTASLGIRPFTSSQNVKFI